MRHEPLNPRPELKLESWQDRALAAEARASKAEALLGEAVGALEQMLTAVDAGDIDSVEMGGEPEVGIAPYRWHEEWAHYTRDLLSRTRGEAG